MSSKDSINAIQEFICFNQKNTIKYEYIISEKHKIIKDYYKRSEDIDLKHLNKLYDDLIISSYDNLISIFDSNKQLIFNVFKAIGKNRPPRITIKTIHEDEVLNIYRSTRYTDFNTSAIKDNTGFSYILLKNKLYYLENDIPGKFFSSKYNNARLKESSKEKYKNKELLWSECWESLDNEPVEYYSSTLILPMSIRSDSNDKKDSSFYNHFFKDVKQHKDSRTIWGFLCFDDIEKNYFDNKTDFVAIGYTIADILSLYLMYFYNHISGSSTIMEIEKELLDFHDPVIK